MSKLFDPGAFTAAYARAFAMGEARQIAAFYAVPCLTIRPDGSSHVFGSQAEAALFFTSILTAYRVEGMADFVASNGDLRPLGLG